MNAAEVLLVGLGLGVRHAIDADHVVVVSTLLTREPGVWRAARVAALWGVGHTIAFLGLGFLIVLAGLRVPAMFETAVDLVVGCMLLGLGALHLVRSLQPRRGEAIPARVTARPLAIGLVHGLAGSAGLALIAATTLASRLLASAYLVVVALGTVAGMVALTAAMARPLAWTLREQGRAKQLVGTVAGLLSATLGIWILIRTGIATPP